MQIYLILIKFRYLCNNTYTFKSDFCMFSKETYISRREELKKLVNNGLIILFGNNEAPYNCPGNCYAPLRQDSSFLYYFGQHRDGLIGVIDVDNNNEYLIGNDIDIDDVVWFGSVDSIADMAAQIGVERIEPISNLINIVKKAQTGKQKIHFLPPYRHDNQILIMDLLGIHPSLQKEAASLELISAVVKMRSKKTEEEIEYIDRACDIGYMMHTKAMELCKPGVTEQFIAGQVNGIAYSHSQSISFATICSQHGEIMHGSPKIVPLEAGRLLLCDAGCELDDYCSDNTRTMPVSGKFTQKQRDIYQIAVDCHDHALSVAKPGVKWMDVHFDICRLMTNRLKDLGLMKGNTEDAVKAGAHALFLPHGLGHMMGMDVHDMESLGQIYVGYDAETRPNLEQFGTSSLRMGRRLEEGFVITDEPGIYFIPDLIDDWRKQDLHKDFINYDNVNSYRDFGGIRIEDDLLITKDGCRFMGNKRIPYQPDDVENYMKESNLN